jgi:hypothetical protein
VIVEAVHWWHCDRRDAGTEMEDTAVLKLLSRLVILAAIGAAIGFVAQRRKQENQRDVWDAEDPDGDWGLAKMELQGSP